MMKDPYVGLGWVRQQFSQLFVNPTGEETPMTEKPYGEVLDDMDHQAKYQAATIDTKREGELRIQALGAAISRRDWHAVEVAYGAIRPGAYGNRRHALSFDDEEREQLDEIDEAIERAKFELTTAERERMEAWLSENHIQESDIEF